MPVSSRLTRKTPSIRPTVGKVLDAGEPHLLELAEKQVADHERIGGADAGEHRSVAHRRQDLVGHLLDDRVGVAIRHQAGERAAPGHAEPARVVDDDQIDAAGLLALGADARAGAAADESADPRRPSCETAP